MTAPPDGGAPAPCARQDAAAQERLARGLACAAADDWPQAVACYRQAVEAAPQDAALWLHLAHACLRLGDAAGGAQAARQALALDPRSELGLNLAAQCLQRAGDAQELVALFAGVERSAIRDPTLHLMLGMAQFRLGHWREAVTAYFDVLQRDPRNAAAYAQLGNVFQILRMPEEARESFRNALALGRSPVEMAAAIVFTSLEAARWEDLDKDLAALRRLHAAGHGTVQPFFGLNFLATREEQLAAAQAHAAQALRGIQALPAPAPRPPGRVLRVGYVSSDLQEHATAQLIVEVFERHDPARVSIHAYSYGEDDGSPLRARVVAAFGERFTDVRALDAAALAHRIRADAIDVLVDLKGYTLLSRNEVFAWRPAPVQVNFLGFPGTLGSPNYDYIVGDPVVTPLEHAAGYCEKIAQMPVCYQPNDRRRALPAPTPRAGLGLPEGALVLASFNANYKITPQRFALWCGLLREIEDAVLWLYVANPQARRNLVAQAQAQGVDAGRLAWAEHLPGEQHLARLQAADLFLDTAPVNAHTSASDALWAGVPVLTTLGETFAGRVAASLVRAAGLPELVAADDAHYAELARALARDRGRLAELRARLRRNRDLAPLFDSARYVRDFEDLLERMVERHDRGSAPDHLAANSRPV